MAARKCDPYFVRSFIELNARIDATTLSGMNPLHYVAINVGKKKSSGGIMIINMLLNAAGDKKLIVPDIHGFTPIDYAKFCKEARILFLEKYMEEILLPYAPLAEIKEEKILTNVSNYFIICNQCK